MPASRSSRARRGLDADPLAGDGASAMTGAVVPVDGGLAL